MCSLRFVSCLSFLGAVLFTPPLFADGISVSNSCSDSVGFFPVVPPQPQSTVCGLVQSGFSAGRPGTATANAVASAGYSSDGLITSTIAESYSVTPSGDAYVSDTMTTTLTDSITLIGATGGQAYLSMFYPFLDTSVTSIYPVSGPAYALPDTSNLPYNLLVTYNQPFNLTVAFTSVFESGVQSGTLNDPVSGSATFTTTDQIQFVLSPTPWYGTNLFFTPLPQYTLQSDLGINYDVMPYILAPEPGTLSLLLLAIASLAIIQIRSLRSVIRFGKM